MKENRKAGNTHKENKCRCIPNWCVKRQSLPEEREPLGLDSRHFTEAGRNDNQGVKCVYKLTPAPPSLAIHAAGALLRENKRKGCLSVYVVCAFLGCGENIVFKEALFFVQKSRHVC